MGSALEIEPCRCGGPRKHYRRAGQARALCGLVVSEGSPEASDSDCLNCARRKKEIERYTPAPRRFQTAMVRNSEGVHLVAVRPSSPEWTAQTTVCGKKVDSLVAYEAEVSCKRCRAGAGESA